jgi:hypothetical protein
MSIFICVNIHILLHFSISIFMYLKIIKYKYIIQTVDNNIIVYPLKGMQYNPCTIVEGEGEQIRRNLHG